MQQLGVSDGVRFEHSSSGYKGHYLAVNAARSNQCWQGFGLQVCLAGSVRAAQQQVMGTREDLPS
jgi:hypothetical protein